MRLKTPCDDPALRDGIASLPEMEDIQLELPLLQSSPEDQALLVDEEPHPLASETIIRI
ncbi:hypothetical protein [Rhizobium sp. RM]|uniref:hypothetical protein n=1 Tax=Rhizobium sp. RM TaxID=2748079 RepID=UPI0015B44FD9|nr:hypothetical protein [Rhizobium sp. RM]NWJ23547.1 hypothetical protein [Rhizobium sp. RM]